MTFLDKLSMTSEIEELKRRLTRTEVEKKEIDANRARLDREVAVLRKHLQTVIPLMVFGKKNNFSWKKRRRARSRQ